MPWWGWMLLAWAVVGTAAGLWIAAAGGIARDRERAARAHQYGEVDERMRQADQEAGTAAPAEPPRSASPDVHAVSTRRRRSRMAEFGE